MYMKINFIFNFNFENQYYKFKNYYIINSRSYQNIYLNIM